MKIIVVGCGRIGSELAERLDTEGHQVAVIDPNPDTFYRLHTAFRGRRLTGIGFDRDVLLRAGIEKADALAAVFSNDATNLIVARVARDRFHVPIVVARLYDTRHTELYRRFGLQAVSSTAWGVHRLEQMMTCQQLEYITSLGNGEVQIIEMRIPSRLVGRPLSSLLVGGEVSLVGLTRGGEAYVPSPDTLLEENDLVCLSAVTTAVGRLETMVKQGG